LNKKGNLLVIQDLFGYFKGWNETGITPRIIRHYDYYSNYFDQVDIKTWDSEKVNFNENNINHISFSNIILRRYIYFFFGWVKKFKKYDYIEMAGPTSFFNALPYKLLGSKVLLHYRYCLPKFLERYDSFIKRNILKNIAKIIEFFSFLIADTIAVTTLDLKSNVIENHINEDKIKMLPNFVNIDIFRPIETEKLYDLVYIGRLHPEKNIDLLLDIMKKKENLKLLIVGSFGGLEKKVKERVENEKIINVTLQDNIPNDEVPIYLNKAKIFILVSRVEGHPKALIEAMSCGLPSIVSNVEGNRETVQNRKNGLIVEIVENEISEAIDEILNDEEFQRYLGKNARKFVEDNYSMEKILQKRIALIKGGI